MPKALAPSVIDNLVLKLREGLHHSEIHNQTSVSIGVVVKIRPTHCLDLPKHSGGCPSKLRPADVCQVSNTIGVPVSSHTIHCEAKAAGVEAFIMPKKPALTKDWIKAHRHWTVEEWKRVQWSNETKINHFGSDGQCYAYKWVGQKPQPHQIIPTSKHGGSHILLWAFIRWQVPGYMCKIEGNLNKELYIEILEDEFEQTLEYYGLDMEEVIFMWADASSCTTHIVQQWLQEQGLDVIEWPANSPDLNPIENLGDQLKRELYGYPTPSKLYVAVVGESSGSLG
ncbi:hypothetical protein OPQ81_011944 [Rhizoctonia solani]|nr:hypothetical protein OPQ81_011944 [Rhizoctonia solani]